MVILKIYFWLHWVLKKNLFTLGCAGSSWLHRLFSSCDEGGYLSLWCVGFSSWWRLL